MKSIIHILLGGAFAVVLSTSALATPKTFDDVQLSKAANESIQHALIGVQYPDFALKLTEDFTRSGIELQAQQLVARAVRNTKTANQPKDSVINNAE